MTARRSRDGVLSSVLLLAANILIPAAILVFATGFFPYKPLLPGLATYDTVVDYGDPPAAPFDRVVFMVIDALRSDFVYSENSGFLFTQSLIRDGAALPFTAHATSPTVTMPRLKAITTGSIPSFLDVVLNIDEGDESSSLASQDTWLAQMKAKGTGKLVMYGDDTWLKLFPGTFDRAEGTTSFFVSDFTEVDNNVTRHIAGELQNDDWNTMVLHYLGLDHIGHKGGPRSPHMVAKQREMDGIVRQIYTAIDSEAHLQSTLFVVCGDHGMNDAGNHGASSAGETSPALVFISPKIKALQSNLQSPMPEDESFQYYSTVEQSDLAPTLAALLGFPVPKNNLGALIPDFLPFWPNRRDQVQLLMRNAHQIKEIVVAAFGQQIFETDTDVADFTEFKSDYQELAHDWKELAESYGRDDAKLIPSILKWLHHAQDVLSSMASNYDMSRLYFGQAAAAAALIAALIAAARFTNDTAASFIPLSGIVLAYGIMMFASSYVEEEHHFWYWATTAWFTYLGVKGFNQRGNTSGRREILSSAALLLATRVIRSWNQTGQKFAGGPDIVKMYLNTNPALLWYLISATYLWVHQNLIYGLSGLPIWLSYTTAIGLVLAAFTFKVAFTLEDAPELVTDFARFSLRLNFTQDASLIARARAVFIGLALMTAVTILFMLARRRISVGQNGSSTLLTIYTLLALTQSRPQNIPLYLLFNAQRLVLSSSALAHLSPTELSATSLLLQHAAFFALGGTNSIASVDLSSAYNGVASFDVAAVGFLTFVGNWAGSVWWALATYVMLVEERSRRSRRERMAETEGVEEGEGRGGGEGGLWKAHVGVLTVFVAASVVAVMAACTVLRTHLFVWTVFSPKYLYCVAWSLGQHLVVNVLVGGVFYWLGVIEGK
ncbi:GPI ethanolamine phosphate transferase 2 [Corynascus novoguineensis]|uniref:GPI ethanolamine phosphate transferase 2 n=1 Tax=Corynascus novoguineensis TaxID=1126955 RepID=A0AAN7D0S9_9PEZI|nr:GPI ethanolamine phosphate transferase 2 [Corynascus novoguineensis]